MVVTVEKCLSTDKQSITYFIMESNFTFLPLHIVQIILSFETIEFELLKERDTKHMNLYFGKKNGEIGVLYKHLRIEDEKSIKESHFLPPIWSTIDINLGCYLSVMHYLSESICKWPNDVQCKLNHISIDSVFKRSFHKRFPIGVTQNFIAKFIAKAVSENKLEIQFKFENKIKSTKLCGLTQKPVSVKMMFGSNITFMKLTPLVLDFLQDGRGCYDLSRLFVGEQVSDTISNPCFTPQKFIIEFDKYVDDGVYLLVEEHENLRDSLVENNGRYLFLRPISWFLQSNKRNSPDLHGVIKYMLLRFEDNGDHLDKICVDVGLRESDFHYQFDNIEKIQFNSGYYYIIHMPNDGVMDSEIIFQKKWIKNLDGGFAMKGLSFPTFNSTITISTKNKIEIGCHLSAFYYSVVAYCDGIADSLFYRNEI